jgi:hypothetical protein
MANGRRKNMKGVCLLILPCALLAMPGFAQGNRSLAAVKKIYVGAMGRSDEAERFRILLAGELGKVGFTTTEDPKTADAVLTGALSVRVYAEESRARVAAVLKTPDGLQLWERDFEPRSRFIPGTSDTVKLRAEDVAKALRKDVVKAGK